MLFFSVAVAAKTTKPGEQRMNDRMSLLTKCYYRYPLRIVRLYWHLLFACATITLFLKYSLHPQKFRENIQRFPLRWMEGKFSVISETTEDLMPLFLDSPIDGSSSINKPYAYGLFVLLDFGTSYSRNDAVLQQLSNQDFNFLNCKQVNIFY